MYHCIIQNRPSEFRPFHTLKTGNRNEICRASGVQPIIKPTYLMLNSLNSDLAVRIVVALAPDSLLSSYSSRHRHIILNHHDTLLKPLGILKQHQRVAPFNKIDHLRRQNEDI